MTVLRRIRRNRERAAGLVGVALCVACSGTTEYMLIGTARAEGSEGALQVEEVEGKERMLTVTLEHLPPASRLSEGATAYVVWLSPSSQKPRSSQKPKASKNAPIRAGVLEYNERTLVGRLMVTTPVQGPLDIAVTAETNGQVPGPSDVVVVAQKVEGEED